MNELDEVDDTSEDDNDKTDDSQQISMKMADNDNACVFSTFLYSLAMSICKKTVDDEISRRRA